MRNFKKSVVALLLLVSVIFSFASCDILFNDDEHPEGYTGGFPCYSSVYDCMEGKEIYWLETYEEAMEAIEHLEAYDNDISKSIISSYENDAVDAKYCFIVTTTGAKRLKKDQKWYDHKYSQVTVSYYGFLDKITIEELEHSAVNYYRYFCVGLENKSEFDALVEKSYECDATVDDGYENYERCFVTEKDTGRSIARIGYFNINEHMKALPEDFHEEFPKTIVSIGG